MEDFISIRARYERFPAAVKGAFLLKGADGLPHQVRLESARATELSGGPAQAVGVDLAVLEVSPTQETFVPFEVPTLEIAAGWYQLECDVIVDGEPMGFSPGDRFSMPWPRAAVRRGTVTIGKKVSAVALETLECLGDITRLSFAADTRPSLTLSVDGRRHPILEVAFDDETGRGHVIAYPVLRAHERIAVELRDEPSIEIALP
jgi:hypothetical protein